MPAGCSIQQVCGRLIACVVLPWQALLVRTIAGLRRNTAQRTDERVRLTGEVIQVSWGGGISNIMQMLLTMKSQNVREECSA